MHRNTKRRITGMQMAFMVVLFEIGSTPLFLLGSKAKQDSWIAVAVGAAAGLALLFLFLLLQSRMPDMELSRMLRFGFGRAAGSAAGVIYSLYFAYEAMRNVRDSGELTALTMLQTTPMFITMLISVLIAGYAIWKGAEVIFHLPEILLPGLMLAYFLLIIVFFLMGNADWRRLLPMAENGFMPILNAALPDIVSFPFGQMLVFLMLWPLWKGTGVPVRYTVRAYIGVSLFLIFMNALIIAVLGPILGANSILPLLETVRLLCDLRFIERLDILVTVMIFIGVAIKILIFYYCAVEMMANLTKTSAKGWILLFGALIYGASFLERDYTQHIEIGLGPSLRVDVLFQIAVPVLLTVAVVLRQRFSRASRRE